jgi:branched-chain amino acid transport system substrate-binding protein
MKKYEKVTVWIGAASSRCEQAMGPVNWYFHLHPWDYQQGASYQEGWSEMAKKRPDVKIAKWFNANEGGAFGTASFKAGQAAFKTWKTPKGEQVTLEGEPFKSAAWAGRLPHRAPARERGQTDIFLWTGYDADALPIMEQAKESASLPIFIGSPPGWPIGFGKSPLAEGVTLYGMWAPSIKEVSPVSKHFWEAYNKEYNQEPATYFAPLAYTNIYFVAEGIKKAKTLEKAALIKALRKRSMSPRWERPGHQAEQRDQEPGFHQAEKILQWQKEGSSRSSGPLNFHAQLAHPFPAWDKR